MKNFLQLALLKRSAQAIQLRGNHSETSQVKGYGALNLMHQALTVCSNDANWLC